MNLIESEFENENGHEWFKVESNNILNGKHVCKLCGILRKPTGDNKPCRGKVSVVFR